MTRINGFNPNLPSISTNTSSGSTANQEQTSTEAQSASTNFKSSDEVLSYLANTSYTPVESQKQSETTSKTVIPVSKYVTPDQAKDIAKSVQAFQNLHSSISTVAQNELNISPDLADQVALETIETTYMPV